MSLSIWSDKKIVLISFAAAGATVIAGILHLTMAPGTISRNLGQGILFLVGGLAQIFWAVPVIKRWDKAWQIIGIVGTAVFVILYYSNRFHVLPTGNMLGGGPPGNVLPGEFPRGNITGGEFSRGNITAGQDLGGNRRQGMGFGLGGNSLVIEVCQIVFIGLYTIQSILSSR